MFSMTILHSADDSASVVRGRVNTLGWTGRREFEETWMTYLSVLNAATEDSTSNREELAVLLQVSQHPGGPPMAMGARSVFICGHGVMMCVGKDVPLTGCCQFVICMYGT